MTEKTGVKGWTDNEKVELPFPRFRLPSHNLHANTSHSQLGLMLQIMSKVSPIPWAELILPEGRTIKACQVMIDKEKAKVKKAREDAGLSSVQYKATPKVRELVANHMRKALSIDTSGEQAAGERKNGAAASGGEDAEEAGEGEKPAKKVRKGKKAAEVEDEDGEEAPERSGAKKGGRKAVEVKAEGDALASSDGAQAGGDGEEPITGDVQQDIEGDSMDDMA